MKPYLIQRAKFKINNNKKGIDSILQFDYMGSSEFEWGALPKSLKAIRDNISDYTHMVIDIKGKPISVFCKSSDKSSMEEYLIGVSERKFTLKEFSGFDIYINNDKSRLQFDFWWDIENHLMFWKSSIYDDKEVLSNLIKKPLIEYSA